MYYCPPLLFALVYPLLLSLPPPPGVKVEMMVTDAANRIEENLLAKVGNIREEIKNVENKVSGGGSSSSSSSSSSPE